MSTSKIQGNPYSLPNQSRAGKASKAEANGSPLEIGAVKTSSGVKQTSSAQATAASDVEMSERARAHKKALEIARSTPDVREDKVAALKKQIQDGTYKIDAGAIADGMAREAILDHLAETQGR